MPIRSLARMVQTILYGNRFFPLYTYVILGGIDETDGAYPDGLVRPPPCLEGADQAVVFAYQAPAPSTRLTRSAATSASSAGRPVLPSP